MILRVFLMQFYLILDTKKIIFWAQKNHSETGIFHSYSFILKEKYIQKPQKILLSS